MLYSHLGLSTFVGMLNYDSVSKSHWLVGPYGPTSKLIGSVMNFVFGSVFAYTVEENTIPLLWFLLCLSAWFFCICRVLKPKCEYNIQDGLLGLTMGKVATIPGHDGIRVAVFLICLILGVARPFIESFEDGYRG
ncbi:unnamed protein product [Linum trigynum]|uniref:Uncharacterized protein n=1 Tax=Linum trigynum TaxID=586398 RepID=A0AAV2GGA1_9ROSI